MITQKDWLKIVEFANTSRRESYVGPWGWESDWMLPDASDLLKFILKEIGIKEHINVHTK